MSRGALILRYTAFAVVAVLANLAAQRLVLAGAEPVTPARLATAMAAGTLVGLVVKYRLDKKWIFFDETRGMAAQGRQFALYALMGVATTAVFWITETAFWAIWRTDAARETGAILGLTVGYVTKYLLDRRFVFGPARRTA
jgi:putative flippase GtrA